MKNLLIVFVSLIFSIHVGFSQVQSGPMVGYSDMKEVGLWLQTQKAAKVKIAYWEVGSPQKKFFTDEILTQKKDGFVAKPIADQVTMGKKYNYEVWVDGKKVNFAYPLVFQSQALWQYRTDPPNFKFALGSCNHINEAETDRPGKVYGGGYEIFSSIYDKKPDFMIWGGDNFYYREPDWNTRTGMIHRNTHTRSLKELQPLLASVHNYAIWDDHDYGTNDSDRSFWNKNMSLEMFKLFWSNPNYIFDNEAITGTFEWGDVQFFLMDDRWFKTPNDNFTDEQRDYYGKKQMDWLVDALIGSKASFKIIVTGGQIINPAKIFENMANFEQERNTLIKKITDAKIEGVLFVSGDRHQTSLQKLDRVGTYPLYDVTVSPLTSSPAKAKELEKGSIIEGTLVEERNFCIAEVSGTLKERILKLTIFDVKGTEKWSKQFKKEELK